MKIPAYTFALACLWFLALGSGQEPPTASGHWQGSILNHNREILIELDLGQNRKGEWIGSINIPAQNAKGVPLSDVVVREDVIKFAMRGSAGDAKFDAKLYKDGKAISGVYAQGDVSLPFSARRTGEAVFPPSRTGIAKEMEGLWEGTLESNGKTLRLRLKLSNQRDGTATGTLISVDQEGGEFPITTLTQEGSNLQFQAKTIQGTYDGNLTDGALVGQWTLGSAKLPLTFRRPLEEKKEDKK